MLGHGVLVSITSVRHFRLRDSNKASWVEDGEHFVLAVTTAGRSDTVGNGCNFIDWEAKDSVDVVRRPQGWHLGEAKCLCQWQWCRW